MSTIRPRASDTLLRFRAIVDRIPALIAIHNASGELELENRAAQEYHGRHPGDTRRSETVDVVHPDDVPAMIAATERALTTGQPLELEQRLRGADGVYRWFHVIHYTIQSSQGILGRVVTLFLQWKPCNSQSGRH